MGGKKSLGVFLLAIKFMKVKEIIEELNGTILLKSKCSFSLKLKSSKSAGKISKRLQADLMSDIARRDSFPSLVIISASLSILNI